MTVNQQQKKPKTGPTEATKSKVFDHFRSIGLITADIPFAVQSRGGVCFLTASIGKTFHIYNTESLGLLFVGPSFDGKINALASYEDDTFVSTEAGSLYRVERATIKEKIPLQLNKDESVSSLQVLGDNLLVLSGKSLQVYTLNLKKLVGKIEFSEEATCFLHPHTYLNKVLVAFKSGSMQLWNFRTTKLIHEFNNTQRDAVTCVAQTPVLDIAAIGYEDGRVCLLDLRKDEILFTIKACKTSATSISFRSDAASKPQMAVGSADGMITVWNLESRNLEHTIDAHEKGITSLFFLPGQPIMVSAGMDNAIKEWAFEFEECRLLKSRTGHISPPSLVRFFGSDGFSVLSAGGPEDQSLRMNSILKDSQSHELSQGQLESKARKLQLKASQLKLPPITAIDFFTAKDLKWDNLISAHQGSSSARTWRVDHKSVGKHVFKNSSDPITAVAMSPCGNYGLTGNTKGAIEVYNMQSGQHRKTFLCQGSVLGLAVDQFAKELLVVTKEGALTVFDFNKPAKTLHTEQLPSGAEAFSFKADNGLVAIALTSHQIEVYDLEARRTVRRLAGHSKTIGDMSFSADGKWLVTCSEDKSIRTWDLPSGLVLDSFSVPETPVSVSLSPVGDFLVSVHEGDLSLHLWYNKSILSPLRLNNAMLNWSIPEMSQDNLQRDLVKLSSQPRSKWLGLFHLDTIKTMNKPVMPEEAPKMAPFFLDAALISTAAKRSSDGTEPTETTKRVDDLQLESLLDSPGNLMAYLMGSGASLVQLEILSLPEDITLHSKFLSFILTQIKSRTNFDLVQTYLNVFIRCHREFIAEHQAEFFDLLEQIEAAQEETWGGLESLIQQSLCLTAFCRDRY